jgi:hypothetical protein
MGDGTGTVGTESIASGIALDGKDATCVRVDGKRLRAVYARLEAIMREPGWIVSEGKPERRFAEWRVERRVESGGGALFLGPAFAGETIASIADSPCPTEEETRSVLASICRVAGAMAALEASGRSLPRFIPEAILVSADGILFLPAALADLAGGVSPGAAHLGPAASFAEFVKEFALRVPGAALRADGNPSVGAGRGEREAEAARSRSLATMSPRLDGEIARLAEGGAGSHSRAKIPGMPEWERTLGAAGARGFLRPLSGAELSRAEKKRDGAVKSAAAAIGARDFLKRRSLVLGIVAVLLGGSAVLFVPSFLARTESAMAIQALGPEELVRGYYAAIDSLDSDFVESAARKAASKPDADLVTNIAVLAKYRTAMEGKDARIRAEEWLAAGKPERGDAIVFGLTGLRIVPIGPAPSFMAEYSLWVMDSPGENLPYGPTELKRRDRVVLERRGKGYRIASIERSETAF